MEVQQGDGGERKVSLSRRLSGESYLSLVQRSDGAIHHGVSSMVWYLDVICSCPVILGFQTALRRQEKSMLALANSAAPSGSGLVTVEDTPESVSSLSYTIYP